MWSKRTANRNPGRGRGRSPHGKPNKLELAYLDHLEMRRCAGEVVEYSFESIKLKLAPNTFYEPDVLVLLSDGTLEIHEVKGHWEDDARVKIKVAAELFPIRFIAVTREKGEWHYEKFFKE